MLQSEMKKEIVSQFGLKEGDTGSADVQIALLTQRINALTDHLKANKHDHSTRRALLRLTGRRRRLLAYLEKTATERHSALVGKLGLRR
ncbi:MAG: 30S ribosomal protein S15 [Dehalococcoidia bacterium]|jgi:small subunit ribosomal protein S15|nr:30S ribosomal protein S15 [Dehalococcoidia bacterium]